MGGTGERGERVEHGGCGGRAGLGVQMMPSGCSGEVLEHGGAHCCPHRALLGAWVCSKAAWWCTAGRLTSFARPAAAARTSCDPRHGGRVSAESDPIGSHQPGNGKIVEGNISATSLLLRHVLGNQSAHFPMNNPR